MLDYFAIVHNNVPLSVQYQFYSLYGLLILTFPFGNLGNCKNVQKTKRAWFLISRRLLYLKCNITICLWAFLVLRTKQLYKRSLRTKQLSRVTKLIINFSYYQFMFTKRKTRKIIVHTSEDIGKKRDWKL